MTVDKAGERKEAALFRSKPVEKMALQFAEDGSNWAWVYKFMGKQLPRSASRFYVEVETLEGPLMAKRGDWIVRGLQGEFYPVKPDIFIKSYEPAEAGREPLERDNAELRARINAADAYFPNAALEVINANERADKAERENARLRELAARARAARTRWHEDYGVPVHPRYAEFLEAIGELIEACEGLK